MPLSADEPIRALVASDMIFNGNYVAPELNGTVYLNKPPLYNWILVVFFKLFNSFDEWVLRLPSILSLIGFGVIVFKVTKRHLQDSRFAWIAAVATITAGNLWIYSAYLGHIDVLYSVVVFVQIYALYYYGSKDAWNKAFALSYALAFVGFMMKGLPSIVFQGISLITILVIHKSFKRLWSLPHILSGFIFIIPLAVYLWLFSQYENVELLLDRLLTESSSRTVTDKGFLESIGHIFAFPFLYLLDILPWGFAIFIFVRKDARKLVWAHKFLKTAILLFLFNIIIYWLSPDYRARYVFMLNPLLLIPSLYASYKLLPQKVFSWISVLFGILLVLAPIVMYIISKNVLTALQFWPVLLIVGLGLIGLYFIKQYASANSVYLIVVGLIIARIGYSQYMVPFRVATGPYLSEKIEGQKIGSITKGEQLAMYNSNVALTMNWYISTQRMTSIGTETKDYSFDSYYLVPTEVIKDTSNVETYYTFVRRFEGKPFSLVKFKHRFPEIPKKKK
ncbi:MAG: 4-amino-4-deoxy-L-arabinose transferase-like glycosyltransferase [Bacteroidia bacterium]|jgi:4-amino-4-deoxy-L-arabinose transferase-like glycosyltransferase